MRVVLVVALLLAAVAFAQTTVSGTLGTAVSVTADTDTEIDFGVGGAKLRLTISDTADVTLSVFAATDISIGNPEGYSALAFNIDAGFGYTLELSTGTITTATLTTPSLTTAAAALITGSVSAGCLRYDAEAEAWTGVDIDSYTVATGEIAIDLPLASSYAFFAVSAGAETPALYNEVRTTASGTASAFVYPDGFAMSITGTATGSSDGTVTVSRSDEPTSDDHPADNHIEAFFNIEAEAQTVTAGSLEFTYTAEQIAEADIQVESDLAFAFYNSNSSSWEVVTSSSVDVSARVVTATTTHFSEWAIVEAGSTAAGAAAVSAFLVIAAAVMAVAM